MFSKKSHAIIYGVQLQAAQNMLDFDYLCNRTPSVLCFIDPENKITSYKLFFGKKEMLIYSYPSYEDIPTDTLSRADTMINFASFRRSAQATIEAMEQEVFKNIVIIAEGIPERQTIEVIEKNKKYNCNIIGPATVGALSAGEFRVGNTGGAIENIVSSRLYKSGSVGFVSKSGGMSNEMRRVIADRTDGTNISVAIGGDTYNIATFIDVVEQFESDENIKMIVLLGEVGGIDENRIAEMISAGKIKKPVVAWCIGTIGEVLEGDVQFGHAGAKSDAEQETSSYKNAKLKEAGAIVPNSFMDFGDKIQATYNTFGHNGDTMGNKALDLDIAEKMSDIKNRSQTKFTSTISDERGEELTYNKKLISEFAKDGSFAAVISQLWLKRELPSYATEFINTLLILLADHGPAVAGATNAIVTARAGNDLKSSLISGLTTIGPRFGGAIDGAGNYFSKAVHDGISPEEFIAQMKVQGKRIPGIGHKVKSKFNPDVRCSILLDLSKKHPNNKHLHFALQVEEITLEKRSNLILNVDGMIAVMLLDIFEDIGMSYEEVQDYMKAGIFNAFFILARTTGFIGHILDQKRLQEGLYRTSWDDILYD